MRVYINIRIGGAIYMRVQVHTYIYIYSRVNKKCILSLRLPSKSSFTLSKLRFFGLRKPKTTSFYSLYCVYRFAYCAINTRMSVL